MNQNPDYKDAPLEDLVIDKNGFYWIFDRDTAARYEMVTDGAGHFRGYLRKDQADASSISPSKGASPSPPCPE